MELSLRPRHVTEIRRVLDQFLADHGVPDELLVRARREREELTREAFTRALEGEEELVLHFDRENLFSLQFTHERNGSPIEFVRISGKDGSYLSHELNTIFTLIVTNNLPTLEKVLLTLLDFGKNVQSRRSRLSVRPTSCLEMFPRFQVPSPPFHGECYGGGQNRNVTELFRHFAERGKIEEHKRFQVIYQWGSTLRIDLIEIRHPKEGSVCFIAVNGIITVWYRD